METVKVQKQPQEEIFAEHDSKKKLDENIQSPEQDLENLIPTNSSIELDKHQLFFHSQPNKIAYDTVTIKNTGQTCIYYQWQKSSNAFQLEDKRSDGMDRFFCHYGDDKIYPDEEKEFTFSFFSEKNGVFSEEWGLVTTPPLPDCDLNIHLNGLVHKFEDFYSENINKLDKKIQDSESTTRINEFVLDLIDTIREQPAKRPNMFNEKIFAYYFKLLNKEYNIEFSSKVMRNLNKLNNDIMNEILGINEEFPLPPEPPKQTESPKEEPMNTIESKEEKKSEKSTKKIPKKTEKKTEKKEETKEEKQTEESKEEKKTEESKIELPKIEEFFEPKNSNEEQKFWNGSIDEIKKRISLVKDEAKKFDFSNKLNCILHISRKKGPEESPVYDFVRNIFLEQLENINETSNKIREELSMPPYTFDLLTRQKLNEEDLKNYDAELKKRKEEFLKKNKKKPAGKGEEDATEVYKKKLEEELSKNILEKIDGIESQQVKNGLKDKLLNANILNESYIDRLSRMKNLNSVKTEGGFDNKYVVLRMDLEECKRNYEDEVDEDGKVIGRHLKNIDFLNSKDKMMQSLNYLLNNGVRVVLLLVDFGPKSGVFTPEFSVKDLVPYIESGLDHPAFYCKTLEELVDYNKKIDDDDLKDNCCIVMENINFFQEECNKENFKDELLNPNGNEKSLSLYRKNKFLEELMGKSTIYVNDSIYRFDKNIPSILDVNVPLKVVGAKISDQLQKILDFFNIDNKSYALIMGDNDVFRIKSHNIPQKNKSENNNGENNEKHLLENVLDDVENSGTTEILDYSSEETMITSLLIINAIMSRFKKIFIFGKLALQFIQFLRHDYEIFDKNLYKINENIFQLMKYILIKAHLLKIEIILPDDFKILEKEEFKKHFIPFVDSNGQSKDYTKEIKFLLKRERIQRRLENAYTDPEELADNADYQRVKLENEQIEHLKLYKNKTVIIDKMPYCYDFVEEFQKAQKIEKPRKIFKTTLEEHKFNEQIYDKEIIYPEEVLQACEHNNEKLKKYLESLNQPNEEEQKNEEKTEKKDENKETIDSKKEKKTKENKETKDKDNKESQPKEEDQVEEKKEEVIEDKPKKKKLRDPRLYDHEKMELVDFGEHSYQKLIDSISDLHGLMWIGRLSPSKCENMFDNYIRIINKINERKKELKEKFDEEQALEEKKILETDLKARKQLLNIFMKGKSTYETVKDNYRMIITGQANPDELGEEDEGGQDEEQFNHDMHRLIDYYIDDDFELINSIMEGNHIAGIYGLDKEEYTEKEEEFDPKSIEEITN